MPIGNITQSVSTIPEAGRRGVDVQTVFVTKQEDFQDHLVGTTVTELNTLKDQLNTRIGEINSTATTMNGYADTASAGASTATTKAGEASTSASEALTSRNQAETFKNNASASATKASQWADNNYNVEVETGKYSAKHWATVAENATSGKIDKVISTDNALVRFDGTTGAVQNSSVIVDDNGNLTIASGALRGSHGGGNVVSNTAVGDSALPNNTTGYSNTAVGVNALYSNTTGNQNTASGGYALYNNTTGTSNTANGLNALYKNTTGYNNTASGLNALQNNTTGNQNTASGVYALNSNTTFSNVSGFGYNSQVTGSNQVQLGDSETTTYVYGTVANRSDERDKADIRDTVLGLEFIQSLRPVDYKWDMREDYKTERPKEPEIEKPSESDEDYEAKLAEYESIQEAYKLEIDGWLESNKLANIVRDGSKKRNRYHQGFIAQEVLALGVEFGGIQDHSIKGGDDVLSIGYDELIAPMVKAIQELKAEIEFLKGGN